MKHLRLMAFGVGMLLVLGACKKEELSPCEINFTANRTFSNKTEHTVEYYVNGGFKASVKPEEEWKETLVQGRYAFEYRNAATGDILDSGLFDVFPCENTISTLKAMGSKEDKE